MAGVALLLVTMMVGPSFLTSNSRVNTVTYYTTQLEAGRFLNEATADERDLVLYSGGDAFIGHYYVPFADLKSPLGLDQGAVRTAADVSDNYETLVFQFSAISPGVGTKIFWVDGALFTRYRHVLGEASALSIVETVAKALQNGRRVYANGTVTLWQA